MRNGWKDDHYVKEEEVESETIDRHRKSKVWQNGLVQVSDFTAAGGSLGVIARRGTLSAHPEDK